LTSSSGAAPLGGRPLSPLAFDEHIVEGPSPFAKREIAMIGGIGYWELLLIAFVALLLFGHRFPSVMGSVGKGIKEFKAALFGEEPDASDSSIHG
jgi:TatA/E family protein of Tat protein translocase